MCTRGLPGRSPAPLSEAHTRCCLIVAVPAFCPLPFRPHWSLRQTTIHALQTFGPGSTWLAALDVDEYVAAPSDSKPGFLERYLRVYEGLNPDTSQILLQSFLFIGAPEVCLPPPPPTSPPLFVSSLGWTTAWLLARSSPGTATSHCALQCAAASLGTPACSWQAFYTYCIVQCTVL